jgi:molybdopterin/thiamine biosynthesis adenylyltransferase
MMAGPGQPDRRPDAAALRQFVGTHVDGDVLPWHGQREVMARFGLSCAESEDLILAAGLLPARYARNRRMLTTALQLRLHRSRVVVVGCGGLGGFLLEELARLGVGHLVALDPDSFAEHNLNRQLLATASTLGLNKAEAAATRIAEVNPAVTVYPLVAAFEPGDHAPFAGADVVADALDEVPARLSLADACRAMGIPLVHGAIAGWYGYVTTIFPGDQTLQHLYHRHASRRGIEAQLGNPSFTPAVVASLQVAEICKILIGQGALLRKKVLAINLLDCDIDTVTLDED